MSENRLGRLALGVTLLTGVLTASDIYLMSGRDLRQGIDDPFFGAKVIMAPTQDRFAFVTERNNVNVLQVYDKATNEIRIVTASVENVSTIDKLTWSPDGKMLAYVFSTKPDNSPHAGEWAVMTVNSTGEKLATLANGDDKNPVSSLTWQNEKTLILNFSQGGKVTAKP